MWQQVPEERHDWASGLDRYVWAILTTRLYSPLIAVWLALCSIPGGSLTARVFEWRPLAVHLAPTAYGLFLFHQMVGQWYWWATRAGAGAAAAAAAAGATADLGPVPPPPPGAGAGAIGLRTSYHWWSYPKE